MALTSYLTSASLFSSSGTPGWWPLGWRVGVRGHKMIAPEVPGWLLAQNICSVNVGRSCVMLVEVYPPTGKCTWSIFKPKWLLDSTSSDSGLYCVHLELCPFKRSYLLVYSVVGIAMFLCSLVFCTKSMLSEPFRVQNSGCRRYFEPQLEVS